MSVDISQFLDTFYEESAEGIEVMESELLELDIESPNLESINTIFRAAHSIKGGSGTFGLQDVAAFTHVMETLLDEMRDGKRAASTEIVELLLRAVDIIKVLLDANKNKEDYDQNQIEAVKAEFETLLGLEPEDKTDSSSESAFVENGTQLKSYTINFKPYPEMLKTGNDPVRMFAELNKLGELEVEVNHSNIPDLELFQFDECYLSWQLVLKTSSKVESISEIFEWVDDECELDISEQIIETVATTPEKSVDNVGAEPGVVAADSATKEESTAPAKVASKKTQRSGADTSSIRVGIDKVDSLINMVGELVITQSMLSQLGKDFDVTKLERLKDGLGQLERNTRELQETVMRIRMLPISFAFNRFPRLVHDLSKKLNKQITLKLSGEQTEIDKTVLEKIIDPLVHLVRNSIDHGIEDPETRVKNGKPAEGLITLDAFHKGGNIVIEIRDDGAGLNRDRIIAKAKEKGLVSADAELSDSEINELVFHPGFSTADVVSDVSGRGVGMDVVKRNISALSGVIEVESTPGVGTLFRVRLPLTLAIMDGQLIRIGSETYIVPLVSIIESLQVKKSQVSVITGRAEVYKLRDDYIEVLRLYQALEIKADNEELINGLLVVVEGEGKKVGFLVDDLLDQQQVVIKSLETNYKKVQGISGATILGDGTVAMILDVQGLIQNAHEKTSIGDVDTKDMSEVA